MLLGPRLSCPLNFHGGVHIGGRHTRGTGFTKDRKNELSPAFGVDRAGSYPGTHQIRPVARCLAARRLQSGPRPEDQTMTNSIEMALRLFTERRTT